MNNNILLKEEKNSIVTLTLNRPEVMNSFNFDSEENVYDSTIVVEICDLLETYQNSYYNPEEINPILVYGDSLDISDNSFVIFSNPEIGNSFSNQVSILHLMLQ